MILTLSMLNPVANEFGLLIQRGRKAQRPVGKNFASPHKLLQFKFLAVEQSTVEQSSFEPGTDLTFLAVLTEYDIPVEKRSQVQVEMTRLNGSLVMLPMSATEPGTFELTFKATYADIYHV